MDKTLIMSLENHHIYYITDSKAAFYIAVPYKKFNASNITIELRDDTRQLAFNNENASALIERLKTIYTKIDNYNISLIIPVINGAFLDSLRVNNDERMFNILDKALAKVINYAYMALSEGRVKVENEIVMVNNEKYKQFMAWFKQKYGTRCKYQTLMEMIAGSVNTADNLDKVELSGINFVVGKEQQEEEVLEDNSNKMELDSTLILNEIELPEDSAPIRKEAHQAGYISYYLLGVISIGISLVILYLLL